MQNVSFTLKRGECIGLIGHNGAGKSTLLKIINGLIKPDAGKIGLRGKVGALIELGAGFNPILTGRENIYNNAAVLGFSRKDLDAKLDSIIAFSEIEEFLDMPVQNYSSGMKVRLGFAVAVHLEPDILLIDEVLAVGDLGFVLKCFKSIDELLPSTAVIFVSHSMPMVSRICNQIILMEKGKVRYHGSDVSKGIDLYYNEFKNNDNEIVFNDHSLELEEFSFGRKNGNGNYTELKWGDDLIINMKFKNLKLKTFPYINVVLSDKEQRGVALLNFEKNDEIITNDSFTVKLVTEKIRLSTGVYSLSIGVAREYRKNVCLKINDCATLKIIHKSQIWQPFLLETSQSIT